MGLAEVKHISNWLNYSSVDLACQDTSKPLPSLVRKGVNDSSCLLKRVRKLLNSLEPVHNGIH